ncbi:MAG: tetratricopeptide repeat protein [Myxococcota bacterium]
MGKYPRMVLVLTITLAATPVHGQAGGAPSDTGAAAEAEAREAYRLGTEAAAEERWADSERHFRTAYALSGVTPALFNQAVALRALGRHREARDAFGEVLRDEELTPALRSRAASLRAESARRVATLVLSGLTEAPHRVRLDGQTVEDTGARPLRLDADEGARTLTVEREGYLVFRWSGDLAPGETRPLTISLDPVPGPEVQVVEIEVPGEAPRRVARSPWLWTIVGLVLIGAGIGVGIYLDRDAQLDCPAERCLPL